MGELDTYARVWRTHASTIKGGGQPYDDLLEELVDHLELSIVKQLRSWTTRDPFTSMTINRIRREIAFDRAAVPSEEVEEVVFVPAAAAAAAAAAPSSPITRRRGRVTAGKARLRGAAWASKTFTIKHLQLIDPVVAKAIKAAFPEDLHDTVAHEVVQVVGNDGAIPSTKELCDAVTDLTGVASSAAE